ncbi:1-aminocyclopropane-1-carboxylate oxidase-like protein 4-like [Senna tora]|uniref:1-aminocyclopropane-1-carboxylate oxidase-like protein 4-like n=1 Tax=Senna tora TaxID=362788 RepID=A0A834WQ38_9FABA|nr:1-aminocyclopropane-1-carboxylate oxidase-like protein 4-like [Senna tora]
MAPPTASNDSTNNNNNNNESLNERKQFEETRAGVKGLVDSGVTTIPSFFINPPEVISTLKSSPSNIGVEIPTIDLFGINSPTTRLVVVDQIKRAASSVGFFQVINHGIPLEVKAPMFRREIEGVTFKSNVDLYHSKAGYWRDSLMIQMGPKPLKLEDIPEVGRDDLVEYNRRTVPVAELVLELLSEGLGLSRGSLNELTFSQAVTLVGHYYPYCPQPDLAVGFRSHTDPGVLTVLLQDHMGGLQVQLKEGWVDVKPIVSNETYKSVDHRVLASGSREPRISIASFFNPGAEENVYGPLEQLTSAEEPPLYRRVTFKDYMAKFFSKEIHNTSQTDYFRI